MVILPDLVSKKITNWFDLVRPLIAFKFQTVSEKASCPDAKSSIDKAEVSRYPIFISINSSVNAVPPGIHFPPALIDASAIPH